jgi:hypothetical protein
MELIALQIEPATLKHVTKSNDLNLSSKGTTVEQVGLFQLTDKEIIDWGL